MAIKEAISKVLGKASLAKKIRTLFREQDIMITSVLMAIGMATGVLVEVLLPSEGAVTQGKDGGDGTPEDVKEWLRNKLKVWHQFWGS